MKHTQFGLGLLASAVSVFSFASWAKADGLLYQLPEDGRWVRFHVNMTMEHGDAEPGKMTGSLTMRSVGQETVEGDKCRWIEFELIPDKAEGDPQAPPHGPPHIIMKVLLPEANLQKGKEPLERLVKGWIKEGDDEPRELKDPNSEHTGPLPAFLSGPLKDVKELDKKTIDTKLGKLECDGITANNVYKQGEATTTVQFETRLHDKAPFGVVTSKMQYDSKHGDNEEKGTLALNLDDIGQDAKSSLPDSR